MKGRTTNMQSKFAKLTPRLLTLGAAMLLPFAAVQAFAVAPTANGTLTVSATVASSITISFNNASGSDTVTGGSGTNAATLNFGTISAYGTPSDTHVTITPGTNNFTASTPVAVTVNVANDTAGCTLTATGTDTTYTWAANSTTVSTTTGTSDVMGGACSTTAANTVNLKLTVPTTGGTVTAQPTNTITFTATGN